MDADDAKDLERYSKDKRRAESKNKLSEVAQLCNCIGEIYSKYGRYEDAIQEHTQERHLSDALGDKIGEAVACRKIGENLCSLGQYKEALELQKRHLTIARECGNHLEEQRAWATIGRTYLSQSETRNIQESLMAGKRAEKAFVKALEACEKVKGAVKLTEYMAMKGRLYLNIGLVYDLRGDLKQSADVMKRAVSIAEKFKLDDELYMCHSSLANMYQKGGQYSQALRSMELALKLADKLRNKVWERELFVHKATIHVSIGDFLAAKHCLKKAHKLKIESDISEKKLMKMFSCVNKMQEATQDLETETDERKVAKLYEIVADCHAEIGNYTEAIENYLKVDQYSTMMSCDERAAIYVSLAQSYADLRQYDHAIQFYNRELEERKENPEQYCRTLLNIADLEELKGSKYVTICKIYMSAFEAAKKAKHPKLQVQTLKSLVVLQKLCKQTTHLEETEKKLQSVMKKYNILDDSDSQNDEDDNASEGSERMEGEGKDQKEDDGNLSISDLTVSDESDCDQENLVADLGGGRKKKSKLARRNEKGETPLHRACIDGNIKKVRSLIAEGHPVNPRDYCGWLPLHEACNHGHLGIVQFLLDSGASINDRGGERCGGITPLIDAASCGNLDIVRLLVNRGANIMAKDDDGNCALDSLQAWHSRTREMIGGSDELEYVAVKKLLQGQGNPSIQNSRAGKTRPSLTTSTALSQSQAGRHSTQQRQSLRLPNLSEESEDHAEKTSVKSKMPIRSLRERLTQLRQKKEKQPVRSRKSREEKQGNKSSDEEISDSDSIYHQLQLSPTIHDLNDPDMATEVYRSAIDNIGTSAQRRLATETQSDHEDDSDSDSLEPRSALVNAEDDVGDDWLINDMQVPKAKKKSTAVNDIFTTNSSRAHLVTTRKRARTEEAKPGMKSKFSGLLQKRSKQSRLLDDRNITSSPRNTAMAVTTDKQDTRGEYPDLDDSSNEACPVSSSTEVTHNRDTTAGRTDPRKKDYEWDSDDDMLCQIDFIDDNDFNGTTVSGDMSRSFQNSSLLDKSLNSTGVSPSPVLRGIEHAIPFAGRHTSVQASVDSPEKRFQNREQNNAVNVNNNGLGRSTDLLNKIAQAFEESGTNSSQTPSIPPAQHIEKPTYKNSMRVKVKIGQHTLLIPIQPADQERTISWLVQQARERYFNMFLMRPTLTLATQDETILCQNDTISMVLQDSEILTASVSAWERPRLEERYAQSCKLCLGEVNKPVFSALQQCDLSGQLQLGDMGLGFSSLQPVFQALDGQKTMTELRINGNRLGDSGVESLMKLIASLPVLKVLTLDTNGISANGIQSMASILKSETCLQSLTTLSLSHNCLDDIAADPLTSVIRDLPELRQLSLCSCSMTAKVFTPSFCDSLKGKRLTHVNMAENQIRDDGIGSLLRSLHPDCLEVLDISHTRTASDRDITQCIQDFVSQDGCFVRELYLAGCHLSEADVLFVNRLPVVAKSLRSLSLSQNQRFNNTNLQKLLYLSADSGSELEELTARGCSIVSPLNSELLDAVRRKMLCPFPLKKFVFSSRGLKDADKQAVQEIWMGRWKEKGQIRCVGVAVSLSVTL